VQPNDTFVRIWRGITEWAWYQDGNTVRVFLHLIIKANIKDNEFKGIIIRRGQTAISQLTIAEQLGISRQNVRTAINHLKATNTITIEKKGKHSIITINNYDEYQPITNKLTTNQPQTNQQLTTNQPRYNNIINKECNNDSLYIDERKQIIDYLNQKAGTHYRANTKNTQKHIIARLKEGFTVDDFKKVIDNKVKEWTNTDFAKYLRPETLFGVKFESYLNSAPRSIEPTQQYKQGVDYF